MRWLVAFLVSAAFCGGLAIAEDVPVALPRPRPVLWTEPHSFAEAAGPNFNSAEVTAEPSDCRKRLELIATVVPMPRLIGPGACRVGDALEIDGVRLPDGGEVALHPAPLLRCEMAEQLAAWVREDAVPGIAKAGGALKRIETYDDFECRGRNRVNGAKLSEHCKGNAVDVRAFALADNRVLMLTDETVAKPLREEIRASACARFTTVLGPGSDSHHESHIHLDLAERHMVTASANGTCASLRRPTSPRRYRCRFHGRKSFSLRMAENSSPPVHHSGVALAHGNNRPPECHAPSSVARARAGHHAPRLH